MASLCRGKRTSNPNKCAKIKACKTTKAGKRKSYCRLKKNKKTAKKSPKKKRKHKKISEFNRLKGYNKKQVRALKALV